MGTVSVIWWCGIYPKFVFLVVKGIDKLGSDKISKQ